MKKFLKWIANIADDVLAYVLTVAGILFSNVLPYLNSNESFAVHISAWRISGALLVALLITLWQETLKPDEDGSKVLSRQGRKKKFIQRMFNALLFGFGSAGIIDKIMLLI
jgi:hypothetical protein